MVFAGLARSVRYGELFGDLHTKGEYFHIALL